MKYAIVIFVLVLAAASCKSIPLPSSDDVKEAAVQIAVDAVCREIEKSGCYDEITAALPDLTKGTCSETMTILISSAQKIQAIYEEKGADPSIVDELGKIPLGLVNRDIWDPMSVDIEKLAGLQGGKCSKIIRAIGVK